VGVFLDLKKAFDTVPHDILLKKLEKLGINGTALLWFKNYLSDRTQKVEINGTLSDSKDLNMSVFQGTCLGPILFLCFINDLPNATELLSILYADDTTALDSHADLPTLITRISSELSKLAQWFQANKMSLNTSKTKYIIFHVPSKKFTLT
jgi:methylaspartate ammonia-lyase